MNNDRYWQIQLIGFGGFAAVYRAVDVNTGRTVAIKALNNPTLEKLRRFKRERDILDIHLNNPFVVDILNSDLVATPPYLVLEYSDLGSLQKYVTNRRDWRRIAGWLYDVARGLEIVHERGNLHRDLKPSNLLRFRGENRKELIKITDFGLGQRPDNPSGTMTTSPRGTEGYIDPIAQMTQRFTSASDIYALGKTMRELLTGTRDLLCTIPGPPEFRALIESMTDLKANRRPTARRISEQMPVILQTPATLAVPEFGGKGLLWLLAGAAAIAVVANSNTWDNSVQRYRDSNGEFRSGWGF